ncbi:MAG: hypothetical protein FJ314_04170 [SAR202 cluster bacterium]|nr:hypothetical protein [SAR202 cluster bacterium]
MRLTIDSAIHRSRLLLLLTAVVAALAVACGGEGTTAVNPAGQPAASGTDSFARIRPARAYEVDEVIAAGFKRSKTYDVAELTGASAALYGFYGSDPYNRKEYEIRFYPTHDDAVKVGFPASKEAWGPDAKLSEDDATWKVGLTERRECQGNVRGSHHVGKCLNPKYLDMVVYGNMVILCQGREVADSRQNCEDLLKVLPK